MGRRLAFFGMPVIVTFLLGICALCGCGSAKTKAEAVRLTDTAMGTIVNVTAYPQGGQDGEAILQEELSLVRSLEEKLLSRRLETSEVYQVNQKSGSGQNMRISEELMEILERCAQMTKDSQGAFDVALGELVALWRIDELAARAAEENGGGESRGELVPSPEEIQKALDRSGMENVLMGEGELCLTGNASLDLGSVGKGVALDEILVDLTKRAGESGSAGISAGVFSLGGSILTYGEKPDRKPWKVAVTDPMDPGKIVGSLSLSGTWFISTSGDYERYFEWEGKRYHHLMDPATGYPAESGLHGVTILSDSGFLSDALSTACFVLGKEKGMELARRYGAEVLFVGEKDELFMSDGMKDVFSVSAEH